MSSERRQGTDPSRVPLPFLFCANFISEAPVKPECDQPWQANSHTTLGPMGPLSDTENLSPATEMVSSQLCPRPVNRGRTAEQRGKLARHDNTANASRFSYKTTRSSYGKCRAELRTHRQCPNRRISHFAIRGQNGDHMPLADSDTTMRPTGSCPSMEYFVPATKNAPFQLRTHGHGPATRTLARYPRHANITACYSSFLEVS